jgi:ABC-type multidrug transport system fused ATPase/permease subunit
VAISKTSKIAEKYYNLTKPIAEFFTRPQSIQLKEVDFDKPWWKFLFQFKGMIVLGNISEFAQASVSATVPLVIAEAISTSNISYAWIVLGMYIGAELLNRLVLILLSRTEANLEYSVLYSGARVVMAKDPKLHIFQSTGKTLSKINRGAMAFRNLLWMLNDGLVSAIMGFITTVVTLSYFSLQLGLAAFICLSVYTLISYFLGRLNARTYGKANIETQDNYQGTFTESVSQILFIRSLFATREQLSKVSYSSKQAMRNSVNMSFSYGMQLTLMRLVVFAGIFAVIVVLISLVSSSQLEAVTAVALTSTLALGIGRVSGFGRLLRNFVENVQRVNTLFDYIRDFGPQTYPVLEGDKVEE